MPDLPAERDHLGRQDLVAALAAMIRSGEQQTPLTIAVFGEWGAGKTTVLRELRRAWRRPLRRLWAQWWRPSDRRIPWVHYVEFNAWEYEQVDNVAAGFAQEVIRGVVDRTWNKFEVAETPKGWERLLWIAFTLPRLWRTLLGLQYLLKRHDRQVSMFFFSVLILGVCSYFLIASFRLDPSSMGWLGVGVWGIPVEVVAGVGLSTLWGWLLTKALSIIKMAYAWHAAGYLALPEYREHLGLIPELKKDVETVVCLRYATNCLIGLVARPWWWRRRLVIGIDDLDRCSPEKVVEILDATRLVAHLPEVVILVAMDPRILLQSVAARYRGGAGDGRSTEEVARDYLDRVIQLPVHLPQPSGADLEGFIEHGLSSASLSRQSEEPRASHPDTSLETPESRGRDTPSTPPRRDTGNPIGEGTQRLGNRSEPAAAGASAPTLKDSELMSGARSETQAPRSQPRGGDEAADRSVTHTWEELQAFKEQAGLFQISNLRKLRRLLNGYTLLKALKAQEPAESFGSAEPKLAMLRLLFYREFLRGFDPDRRRLLEAWFEGRDGDALPEGFDPVQCGAIRAARQAESSESAPEQRACVERLVDLVTLPCFEVPYESGRSPSVG